MHTDKKEARTRIPPRCFFIRVHLRSSVARFVLPAIQPKAHNHGRKAKASPRRQSFSPGFCESTFFYKYLAAAAAELRLPITVPNPAHAQFISRESTDAREETRALSATRARQLPGLPAGESVLDYRDLAILKFFLYSGARLSTACRLNVSDFHQDGDEATIRLHEKDDKHHTIGIHFSAAQAIADYIEKAELSRGPLFRPRLNPRSQKLGLAAMDPATMYRLVEGYLQQLPGAVKELTTSEGAVARLNVYTPHSLRATTATLLLDSGVHIRKVQALLGHRHITTTQIYDKHADLRQAPSFHFREREP
jgi:integrase